LLSFRRKKIRLLGHYIHLGTIIPIERSITFIDKFLDEIKDKTQLQMFLGSLNYIIDFFPNINIICKPLHQRLQKDPSPWTSVHTNIVKQRKTHVKEIPCLHLAYPFTFKIVETYASEIGYGGIFKQVKNSKEQVVRFISKHWNSTQQNYSTIKKEMLAILFSISKFQGDLLNQKFLLRIDCKSAKDILQKDVLNIVSK